MIDYLQLLLERSADPLYKAQSMAEDLATWVSVVRLEQGGRGVDHPLVQLGWMATDETGGENVALGKGEPVARNELAEMGQDTDNRPGVVWQEDLEQEMEAHSGQLALQRALVRAEQLELAVEAGRRASDEVTGRQTIGGIGAAMPPPLGERWNAISASPRFQVGQGQTAAQLVDRAFQQDSRRYDGGFYLY